MLDHHHLDYQTIEHVPFLGEARLRRLVGTGKKRATVPVLLAGDEVLTESWDIAVYADREGSGPKLVLADREKEIRKWNDLSDETMKAGRSLVIAALLASPDALDESLSSRLPKWIRALSRPVTRHGTKWFARKYELGLDQTTGALGKLRSTLSLLREALSTSSPYLLGTFSYADIVMAVVLQGIVPVDDCYMPIGAATRKTWTRVELAAEFADLVAWRDGLYERHRKRRTKP